MNALERCNFCFRRKESGHRRSIVKDLSDIHDSSIGSNTRIGKNMDFSPFGHEIWTARPPGHHQCRRPFKCRCDILKLFQALLRQWLIPVNHSDCSCRHSDCNRIFASMVSGLTKPRGSKIWATPESKFLLVGLQFEKCEIALSTKTPRPSEIRHHLMPRNLKFVSPVATLVSSNGDFNFMNSATAREFVAHFLSGK